MFKTLLIQELRVVASSPKFAATLAISSLLILLAVGTGLTQYAAFESRQAALRQLTDQELSEQTRWFGLRQRALRPADPLQVFATGSHQDIGRYSTIHAREDVRLTQSVYEDDPILAIFRQLDLTYIVQIVLSLFALVFTYDAVSGERESGVLRLVVSHAVPRRRYLAAKILGNLLGLGVPLLVPLLLGLLLVALVLPLTPFDAARIALCLAAAALMFTFFVLLGVLISASTKRPATSFLVALSCWVILVLVAPRVGLMAASELVRVPDPAEVVGQKDGLARGAWARYEERIRLAWQERDAEVDRQPEPERAGYQDDRLWGWMKEDEELRRSVQDEIDQQSARIDETVRNRKEQQEGLALGLSRWSPASAFRSAAMRLAGTHVDLARRSESAMQSFREEFRRFQFERDPAGGSMTVRSDGEREIRLGDAGAPRLDLSDMPRFAPPRLSLPVILDAVLVDLAWLAVSSLLCFAVAVWRFGSYDAR